jgi:hypothetical protein
VKAYENRVRERFLAKFPTAMQAEGRRLDKEIEKLVQIYARGAEISCWALHRMASARNHGLQAMGQSKSLKLPMNGSNRQAQTPSFRELYGPKRSSVPWEDQRSTSLDSGVIQEIAGDSCFTM